MWKWFFLLLLAGWAWPAMAAKTVTVGQLETLLDTLHGKSDKKVAQQLSGVELMERASSARLARWEKDFPGSDTHEALVKIADLAAFQNPPAADALPIPAPDSETQEQMLTLAADYVKSTSARLPDFLALRETAHFEDTPSTRAVVVGGLPFQGSRAMRAPAAAVSSSEYKALHYTGSSSTGVTYRDGMEVHDSDAAKGAGADVPSTGLTTRGEFGPILSMVIGDAMRSQQVDWERWEQGATDPVAVFRYSVPADQSNYQVRIPSGSKFVVVYPAYHGEIAVDPSTGTILRLSVVAALAPPYEAMQAAMLVEYAPVTIGGKEYICPVHGVAFSRVPVAQAGTPAMNAAEAPLQTHVNDIVFTQFGVFRTSARILAGKDTGNNTTPVPTNPTSATPASHQP